MKRDRHPGFHLVAAEQDGFDEERETVPGVTRTASTQARASETTASPTLVQMGRFIKISHTLFSLPLVFAGMFLAAGGAPSWRTTAFALLAAAGARTAAMALNRIIDREIDAKNARTANRELPSGALRLSQAWLVTAAGLLAYLLGAAALSPFLLAISPIPLAVFVAYPYLKRFTPLCHFGVGLALGLSPLGGWLAVRQTWSGIEEVAPLGLFGMLWVAGFDIIYATLDIDFDRLHGIHSIPARVGQSRAITISGWVHLAAFAGLLLLWWQHGWPTWTLAGVGVVGLLLWVEHRLAERVELAFFNMNIVIGFAVLAFVSAGVFFG
ncbi:MAG: UbiA-like polyprenyltransferase [Candidatus Eisenbacteria bacterium]